MRTWSCGTARKVLSFSPSLCSNAEIVSREIIFNFNPKLNKLDAILRNESIQGKWSSSFPSFTYNKVRGEICISLAVGWCGRTATFLILSPVEAVVQQTLQGCNPFLPHTFVSLQIVGNLPLVAHQYYYYLTEGELDGDAMDRMWTGRNLIILRSKGWCENVSRSSTNAHLPTGSLDLIFCPLQPHSS